MRQKINRCLVICVWLLVIGLLVYSRFVNLSWGLPYPMHPDERNMANAIQQLNCKFPITNFQFPNEFQFSINNFRNCFNPHFFAYGQFPLYLGYVIVFILKFFDGDLGMPISFQEAAISLRIISAIASIINVFVLVKIIKLIIFNFQSASRRINFQLLSLIILIFSPYTIQFAHFGTTESLLMLFYSLIVYLSMRMLERRTTYEVVRLALVSGLAIATKVSSVIFVGIPLIAIINSKVKSQNSKVQFKSQKFFTFNFSLVFLTFTFLLFTLVFSIVFSPHNLINYHDFISAFRYESAVATGQIKVFYTRQFEGTISYLFQAIKVFPYTLGWPIYILSLLGFIFLSWKDRYLNLIRLAILIYFIPSGDIFAKWSRFMAPVLPLMLVIALLFLFKLKDLLIDNNWINSKVKSQNSKVQFKSQKFFTFNFSLVFLTFTFLLLTLVMIIPGISYLSVYQNPDVRFQASKWIYKNISNNSIILSETANVVDIPISNETMEQSKNYNVISFNFYDLDESPALQMELQNHLATADYIFVPSRRIFANHPKDKYPLLNDYYEKLLSGKLGFKKVAEFSSGLNDEAAEETWSVFDHPIIRIYKKT